MKHLPIHLFLNSVQRGLSTHRPSLKFVTEFITILPKPQYPLDLTKPFQII